MGSLYFWSRSIQEMGGNVVRGRSMYGVVGVVILPILRYTYGYTCSKAILYCPGMYPEERFLERCK